MIHMFREFRVVYDIALLEEMLDILVIFITFIEHVL
jgi:hypothetical protein